MDIWTNELGPVTTITDGRASLTVGPAATTLSAAVSSGIIIEVGSTTGFTRGSTIVIDSGGANEEFHLIKNFLTAPIRIELLTTVAISHSIAESVDLVDEILAGQDRTHLVNGHLDQSYELDAPKDMWGYFLNQNGNEFLNGFGIVLKNFRSKPFDIGQTLTLHVGTFNALGNDIALRRTQTILPSEFGNGFPVAIIQTLNDSIQGFLFAGIEGTATAVDAQIANIYLLQKHTISRNWEITDSERLQSGASIIESRSRKKFVIGHTNNFKRSFTKLWRSANSADVATLKDIFRLSDGPRLPIITDIGGAQKVSDLLLVRFANEDAMQIVQRGFDQFDISVQLETLQQEDDR